MLQYCVMVPCMCVPARVCYLCWLKRKRVCRTVQPRCQQYPPAWRVGRWSECMKERERELDISNLTVCLRLLASTCNFDHPHTNSSSQGQTGSPAAQRPPSLTAALLSQDRPSHMPANRGAAWAAWPLTPANQKIVQPKRTPSPSVAKIRGNW